MFNFFKKKKKSVAIVLSGGAARGIAHIGFLKALDENNIPVDAIYGTSVGAIVGALYCCGLTSARLAKIVADLSLTDFIAFKLSKKALFSSEAIERFIKTHIGDMCFKDLTIPFYAMATNIKTGQADCLSHSDLSVAKAVRASASIPGLFTPTEIGDELYIDGAISAHIAQRSFISEDVLIGCNVIPNIDMKSSPKTMVHIIDRAVDCATLAQMPYFESQCDLIVHPVKTHVGSIDLNPLKENAQVQFVHVHLAINNYMIHVKYPAFL